MRFIAAAGGSLGDDPSAATCCRAHRKLPRNSRAAKTSSFPLCLCHRPGPTLSRNACGDLGRAEFSSTALLPSRLLPGTTSLESVIRDRRIPRDRNHKPLMYRANGNGLEKRRTERFSAGRFRGAAHPGPRVGTTASKIQDWQITPPCSPYT